jgi:chemotaxis protein methyltransferase CheR
MNATEDAADLTTISDHEFASFQRLIHALTGIQLAPAKKPLLCGRLAKRLKSRGLASYADYYRLVAPGGDADELETCINLITTNETYFFRESAHFDFLAERLRPLRPARRAVRVWSAACSSGEEPYTLAMVLAETLGLDADWEVLASDISTAVLAKAAAAVYPLARADGIPRPLLQRYCLKGVGADAGSFLVDAPLRSRVLFGQINLNRDLPEVGSFDFIFLRNVMIYFPPDVKRMVVARLAERLSPGGLIFVGLSETLNGLCDGLEPVLPTVYRRVGD